MRTIALVSAALWLCGCASKGVIHSAFDDITSEADSDSTWLVNFGSVVSLSGLGPSNAVGMVFHAPTGLPPRYTIGVSPKWSYVVTSDYSLGLTDQQLRTQYSDLQAKALELASLETMSSVVGRTLRRIKGDPNSAAEDARAVRAAADALDAPCAPCTREELVDELKGRRERIKVLQGELETLKKGIKATLQNSNMFLTRWVRSDNNSAEAAIGEKVEGEARSSTGKSGVAAIADLRVATLHTGEDFLEAARDWGKNTATAFAVSESRFVTFTLKARFAGYVSDESAQRELRAELRKQEGKLGRLQELVGLVAGESVTVAATFAQAQDLGNTGMTVSPETRTEPYCYFPPRLHQEYVERVTERDSRYSTLFAVRAQLSLSILANAGRFSQSLADNESLYWQDYEDYCKKIGPHAGRRIDVGHFIKLHRDELRRLDAKAAKNKP